MMTLACLNDFPPANIFRDYKNKTISKLSPAVNPLNLNFFPSLRVCIKEPILL